MKKIGIIGLGVVGEGTLSSLLKYRSLIKKRTALSFQVKTVCDINAGRKKLVPYSKIAFTTKAEDIINDPEIDVVVELIGGIQPAKKFIIAALQKGKDVVTANKALLAREGKEIFARARDLGCNIGFEASVCGAIPLIKSISQGLVGCEVKCLHGILNGTTNYILSKMHKDGLTFSQALKEAQQKGYAEMKPDLDIAGKDTLHKLCILSYLSFGFWPDPDKLYTEGISRITPLDIAYTEEFSYRIKLLAIARKKGSSLSLRVHPTLIKADHPLAEVSSAFNGVWMDTYPAGELLFYGEGAGGVPTSSAIISDIVNVSLKAKMPLIKEEKLELGEISDLKTRFYIRFMALDRPGVLAEISRILSRHKVSIASVAQKERNKGKLVPIVMLTHETREEDLRKALAKIDDLEMIKGPSQSIRIEDI